MLVLSLIMLVVLYLAGVHMAACYIHKWIDDYWTEADYELFDSKRAIKWYIITSALMWPINEIIVIYRVCIVKRRSNQND